ncbi:DUF4013 domain-containing protein [Patescibacteria group bacterium]|nr:DUF4013 domain-containing protein [Patescibacteria group bacterium]MBU1673752.1 DUF4013 domain-containing protein [Patescibacteria group bacterium]MBU1964092.1 DUF4013 domain-containing protein [Patescibacteria group bacterium]
MKNVGEAFSYQFKEQGWVGTFLLGSLFVILCMFVVTIPFLIGYMIWNTRAVMEKNKELMPKWKNLGAMYMEGLKFFGASLGWGAPILIVIILMIVMGVLLAVYANEEVAIIFTLMMLIMNGFIMIYSIIIAFVAPVLYIKVASKEPYRNLYHLGEIWAFIKNNIGNIIIVLLLGWAAGLIVNVGMLVFFIGLFPAAFYVGTIMSYLYGELYLESKGK